MSLENLKIYTQKELVENGPKNMLIRYRISAESTALAEEFAKLQLQLGTRRAVRKAMAAEPAKYKDLLILDNQGRSYSAPTYNRYLYIETPNGAFVKNVDWSCQRARRKWKVIQEGPYAGYRRVAIDANLIALVDEDSREPIAIIHRNELS